MPITTISTREKTQTDANANSRAAAPGRLRKGGLSIARSDFVQALERVFRVDKLMLNPEKEAHRIGARANAADAFILLADAITDPNPYACMNDLLEAQRLCNDAAKHAYKISDMDESVKLKLGRFIDVERRLIAVKLDSVTNNELSASAESTGQETRQPNPSKPIHFASIRNLEHARKEKTIEMYTYAIWALGAYALAAITMHAGPEFDKVREYVIGGTLGGGTHALCQVVNKFRHTKIIYKALQVRIAEDSRL